MLESTGGFGKPEEPMFSKRGRHLVAERDRLVFQMEGVRGPIPPNTHAIHADYQRKIPQKQ